MGKLLRKYGCSRFADPDFLLALPDFINNPSVTGFFIENASILSNGLPESGFKGLSSPMKSKYFEDEFPGFSTTIGTTLYVPTKFNYPGIDAISVSVQLKTGPKPKLGNPQPLLALLYPIQIIIAETLSF